MTIVPAQKRPWRSARPSLKRMPARACATEATRCSGGVALPGQQPRHTEQPGFHRQQPAAVGRHRHAAGHLGQAPVVGLPARPGHGATACGREYRSSTGRPRRRAGRGSRPRRTRMLPMRSIGVTWKLARSRRQSPNGPALTKAPPWYQPAASSAGSGGTDSTLARNCSDDSTGPETEPRGLCCCPTSCRGWPRRHKRS